MNKTQPLTQRQRRQRLLIFCNELKRLGVRINGKKIFDVRTDGICSEIERVWGTDALLVVDPNGVDRCPLCRGHDVPVAMWWPRSGRIERIHIRTFYVDAWREWRYKLCIKERTLYGRLEKYEMWLDSMDNHKLAMLNAVLGKEGDQTP